MEAGSSEDVDVDIVVVRGLLANDAWVLRVLTILLNNYLLSLLILPVASGVLVV